MKNVVNGKSAQLLGFCVNKGALRLTKLPKPARSISSKFLLTKVSKPDRSISSKFFLTKLLKPVRSISSKFLFELPKVMPLKQIHAIHDNPLAYFSLS